jgi:hypothetical protein
MTDGRFGTVQKRGVTHLLHERETGTTTFCGLGVHPEDVAVTGDQDDPVPDEGNVCDDCRDAVQDQFDQRPGPGGD